MELGGNCTGSSLSKKKKNNFSCVDSSISDLDSEPADGSEAGRRERRRRRKERERRKKDMERRRLEEAMAQDALQQDFFSSSPYTGKITLLEEGCFNHLWLSPLIA